MNCGPSVADLHHAGAGSSGTWQRSQNEQNRPLWGRNWQWRALPGVFTEELDRVHCMMVPYERAN